MKQTKKELRKEIDELIEQNINGITLLLQGTLIIAKLCVQLDIAKKTMNTAISAAEVDGDVNTGRIATILKIGLVAMAEVNTNG